MKLSGGLTRMLPSVLILVFYVLSFACFTFALRRIELNVAYAVWSGLGTALVTLTGFVCFRETATAMKIASIGLIIAGVIGINLAGHPS